MDTFLTTTRNTLTRTSKLALICGLMTAAGLAAPANAEYELNDEGWTILQPSSDTQFIFVSSSEGNDSNSGRTPSQPIRTLAQAKQMMRDHSTDWMLLKRGDTWAESFGSWNYSGRAADEPIVITTYGDAPERPIIKPVSGHGIQTGFGREVSHVAIVGLRFIADRPDHGSKTGIRWLASGEGLLVEDCYIEGFKDNMTIQGSDQFDDVIVRRSVIVDSYSINGHSQGIYVKNVHGILIEENVFDGNGGRNDVPGAEGSTFDQNVYLQVGVLGTVFRGNISSNGSGAGAQLRSGGIAENNLFYSNSLGLRFGYRELDWPQEFASGRIEGNVVLGGELEEGGQGIGMWIERFKNTLIHRNVIAHVETGENSVGINLAGYAESFILQDNVTHDWATGPAGISLKSFIRAGADSIIRGNRWSMENSPKIATVKYPANMSFIDNKSYSTRNDSDLYTVDGAGLRFNQWESHSITQGEEFGPITLPDADRDLGSYARSLGLADEQAFLQHARSMSRGNWDERFTGEAAAEYIRAGYLTGALAGVGEQGPD